MRVGAWILGSAVIASFWACSNDPPADGGGFLGDDGGSSSGGSSSSGGRMDSGRGSSSGSSGSSSSGSNSSGSSSGSSSSSSSGSVGDGGMSFEPACTDLVASGCNRLQECAPYGTIAAFGDVATCIARGKLACPSLFNAPGTGATPSAAEACSKAYMSATCDDLLDNVPPAVCIFQGSIAMGGTCGADAHCAGNALCDLSSGQVCGVCKARVGSGSTCIVSDNCLTGLVCAYATNATSGTCVAPGGQGATCDTTHPCRATLGCSAAGTCGPLLGMGAHCTVQNCDALHGLYCNPTTLVCEQVQSAMPGSTCGLSMGSYAICTASARCSFPSASATAGTCVGTVSEGMSCNATSGAPCLLPAYCANGVCTLPSTTCH
jgi:hypothetical protein